MTPRKITITVKLKVEGLHFFPNADTIFPEVGYLKHIHRHTFHIACEFEVTHTERDKEFILSKHEINNYLTSRYFDLHINCLNFGGMSCESIALELYEKFNLQSCTVGEDGEFESKISIKDYQTQTFTKVN